MRTFAELHVHLEGSLEPELALALASRNGVELPAQDAASLAKTYRGNTAAEFRTQYRTLSTVLCTEQDFTDLTRAYLARAKKAGVVRAEVFCDLQAHLARGIPAEVVLGGVNAALATSEADFGISTGLLLSFLRDQPVEQAEQAYRAAMATGVEILGIGLCSDDSGFGATPFVPLFGQARADGLHTVAHAGVGAGPEAIRETIRVLKIGRVDHGLRAAESQDLINYLLDYQIPLTMCPLANAALGLVPGLASHPVAKLLAEGLNVSLHSDHPAFFGYLDEVVTAVESQFGLTDEQLDQLARNSFDSAFLPAPERAALSRELVGA